MATATVVPGSIVLEVLNQDNYEQWSFRVKTYLLAKDLWDIVEAPTQEFGEGVGDKVWTKKNAEALYAIQISCGTDIFTFIKNSKRPKMHGSENKDQREIDHFETFLKDVKSGDWGKAQEFLAQQPDAV
ncbi:uncharacterized protein Pyn_19047 [Prunus yedoensis var. nudiflora]|uniref:DUF4219 domain-containing protein n=1 Tax=Prunus yedoensis var. nudiflora TaxID=2094558 RepID=A0A314XG16_PRUYE|nr:uncharacterized protein Pyn_19047 [Prunus yedoensis var. nudiflora]